MAIRNLRYEDDEILRKRAREIEVIDDKIKQLAEDMILIGNNHRTENTEGQKDCGVQCHENYQNTKCLHLTWKQ